MQGARPVLPAGVLLATLFAALAGCVGPETLRELESEWQAREERTRDCRGLPAGERAPEPGRAWIGHGIGHLRAAFGSEAFALMTPGGVALCYDNTARRAGATAATGGCIDTYLVNDCGIVTSYYCR